jgi:uncharacterized protein (DUF1015 family)
VVKLFPFEGITYNQKKLKKLDRVFTPPYDVISPEQQDKFYADHDFNYIRLILGKEFTGDGEYNNRYVRAAAFLDGWLRHEILIKNKRPALYIYEQRFKIGGHNFVRLGFIGLLRLEDVGRGKVYPHEETHSRAKIDRLQMLRSTFANLESIFCLYSDEKLKIIKSLKPYMKRKPLIDVKDQDKVQHRLWVVDRSPTIIKIIREMKDKPVFIADGHHRYEAALRFRDELKSRNTKFTEDEAYNHIMVYFTPLEDHGLVVLPIHRVLRNIAYFEPARFEQQLGQFFDITPYLATAKTQESVQKKLTADMAKLGVDKHCFGMYLGHHQFYLLTLKDENMVDDLVAEEKPKAWKRLDTTILRATIIESILGVSQDNEDKITYVKDAAAAVQMIDDNQGQVAFLLNPTKIEEITAIASKLEKMPQKSTFFWPKLLSGLVLYKIAHGDKVKP